MLTLIFSGKLIYECISARYVFVVDVPSKFVEPANKDDVSSSTPSSVAHKYLQVALVADENVAAKHGNHSADFLLVLANIVSGWNFSINTIFNLCVFVTKSISPSVVTDCIATDR